MLCTQRICDLCGKEWASNYGAYKPAQMKIRHYDSYRWTKIDVCGYCLRNIIETSRNERKSDNSEQ